MTNILIIDDKDTRFRLMRSALFEEENADNNEALFPKGTYACYPSTDEEAKGFCGDIAAFAKNKDINGLFLYIYKYIDEHNISCIFTDRSFHDESELKYGEIGSGDEIASRLRKSSLYKNIPLVIYSRKEEEDDTLLGKVPHIPYIEFSGTSSAESYMDEVLATLGNNRQSMIGFHKEIQNFVEHRPFFADMVIICALDREYQYAKEIFSPIEKIQYVLNRYGNEIGYQVGYLQTKDNRILKVVMTNMKGDKFEKRNKGREKAIERAELFVGSFKPKYLLMTGVAAGFKDKKMLKGDLIIATASYQWDFGRTDNGKDTSSDPGRTIHDSIKTLLDERVDYEIVENVGVNKEERSIIDSEYYNEFLNKYNPVFTEKVQFEITKTKDDKLLPHQGKFKIHQGLVTSGNRVIADDKEIKRVLEIRDTAIGLDMEIDAIYGVGKSSNIYFLAIKGVVDYGGDDKDKEWQDFCSFSSAKLMHKLFTEYIDVEQDR